MSTAELTHTRPLRWLFIIQLVSMGAMEMSGPFWPIHLRALGKLDAEQLAWASAIAYLGPMITAMVFTPLWGRIGDRVGHKPMLLRALVALSLTQLYIGFAQDVLSILLTRLIQGALAGFIAASQAYGTHLTGPTERAALMARLQVATAIGSVLGPIAGGMCFAQFGFPMLNLIAALFCAACVLAVMLRLPNLSPTQASKNTADTYTAFRGLSPIMGLLVSITLVQAGKMMPQAFFGLYAQEVLHISTTMTGLCYGATALGLCLAAPWWAKKFADLDRDAILARVIMICGVCAALTALQALSVNLPLFLITRLAWGVCLAALLPVFYGLISREVPHAIQGLALGTGNSAAKAGALIGTGAGALTLGLLPLRYAFWGVSLMYVLSALCMYYLRKRSRSAQAPTQLLAESTTK